MWRIFDFLGKKTPLPWSGRPTIHDAVRTWDGSAAAARGWSSRVRKRIAAKAHAILIAEGREERLRAALRSADPGARFTAWNAASAAGLDLWADAFELARREPPADYLYQWLVDERSDAAAA